MPGKSQSYENEVLNSERGTTYTAPATMHVGLIGTMPSNDAGAGLVEVTGNAYARQPCGFAAPSGMGPASISNASIIDFPVQTPGGYGTVNGVGLWTLLTAGVLKKFAALASPVTFAAGSQARFAAGALISTED